MADLSVELCGRLLPNPFVLASGPLTWNAEAIQAAFDAGVNGIVQKPFSEGQIAEAMKEFAGIQVYSK